MILRIPHGVDSPLLKSCRYGLAPPTSTRGSCHPSEQSHPLALRRGLTDRILVPRNNTAFLFLTCTFLWLMVRHAQRRRRGQVQHRYRPTLAKLRSSRRGESLGSEDKFACMRPRLEMGQTGVGNCGERSRRSSITDGPWTSCWDFQPEGKNRKIASERSCG
ncbi:hypothetical protein BS17DRAFT_77097 [Gyrodon lividus]|nr:hypothetical protein BS17DRAFT_77097 [Gyrodon lividus]